MSMLSRISALACARCATQALGAQSYAFRRPGRAALATASANWGGRGCDSAAKVPAVVAHEVGHALEEAIPQLSQECAT
jgi:hypothetical protein